MNSAIAIPRSELIPTREVAEQPLTLAIHDDGRLWASRAGHSLPVRIRRCFPWSAPDRYLSLHAEDNQEFALITDPSTLDAASRRVLQQALAEASFVFRINKVHAVEEDFELRCFHVETAQGPRAFQTALDAWPRETPEGGLLIEDVAGDVFRIEEPDALDERSRELVWELLD
ncbi:MAG TPA: DUF1854 domain-containing protein [Polyangiaceae bacterium]|jgi:hypothetical protein